MSQLPETMDEVTLAWLEGVLAGHPAFDGVKIAQMRKTPVGEGVGQMSAIARLDLGYDGKPGPASIVVKLHAPFQGMRDVGIRYEMYARETAFYQSLAPEVTVSVPTIYFAGWDPGSTRNALVMEDMSHLHWPDQLSGHTLEQAQACVDAIAQIGASHWGADFAGHDWLPDSHAPVFQRIVGDYQMAAPVALERLAAFTTPRIAGGLRADRQEHHLDLRSAGRAAADPDPLRYAHGELRLRQRELARALADRLAIDGAAAPRLRHRLLPRDQHSRRRCAANTRRRSGRATWRG